LALVIFVPSQRPLRFNCYRKGHKERRKATQSFINSKYNPVYFS